VIILNVCSLHKIFLDIFRAPYELPKHSDRVVTVYLYSVSQSKKSPLGTCGNFSKTGIFQPNFICLLWVPIYARLRIFIQLPATLTKLCHIKRDHPVHIMCTKCPPSAETHTGIFWNFPQTVRNF